MWVTVLRVKRYAAKKTAAKAMKMYASISLMSWTKFFIKELISGQYDGKEKNIWFLANMKGKAIFLLAW